jgi:hypothetical protein
MPFPHFSPLPGILRSKRAPGCGPKQPTSSDGNNNMQLHCRGLLDGQNGCEAQWGTGQKDGATIVGHAPWDSSHSFVTRNPPASRFVFVNISVESIRINAPTDQSSHNIFRARYHWYRTNSSSWVSDALRAYPVCPLLPCSGAPTCYPPPTLPPRVLSGYGEGQGRGNRSTELTPTPQLTNYRDRFAGRGRGLIPILFQEGSRMPSRSRKSLRPPLIKGGGGGGCQGGPVSSGVEGQGGIWPD